MVFILNLNTWVKYRKYVTQVVKWSSASVGLWTRHLFLKTRIKALIRTLLKHLAIISKSLIKYNSKCVLTNTCALKKYTCFGALTEAHVITIIINNSLNLYSAFLGTQRASHGSGESPQPPSMLQHPPG